MKCHEEKYSSIKTNNHIVVQLKTVTKERGIRGYYKVRKAELIHAMETARLVKEINNISDESIPNDPTPVLQLIPCRPSNITTNVKQDIKNFTAKKHAKIKEFR